jgi:hypothetical protein
MFDRSPIQERFLTYASGRQSGHRLPCPKIVAKSLAEMIRAAL